MKAFRCIVSLWLVTVATLSVRAAEEADPKVEMGVMQMVLLTRPADTATAGSDKQLAADQRRETDRLIAAGKIAFAGNSTDDQGSLREILIVKNADTNEARRVAESLPVVKTGNCTADVLPWFGPVNLFKPASSPIRYERYLFALLVRGDNANKIEPDELKKIQAGHMANIRRLADLGKLVIAGPFQSGGDRRGVFIFKVTDLAEAKELAATDPAVKAGRLKLEWTPIEVPAGILP